MAKRSLSLSSISEPDRLMFQRRFLAKVQVESSCWRWVGALSKNGYGAFKIHGVQFVAHRVMFELMYAPIPRGLFACHICDHPWCINPDHLFLGTAQDNADDCVRKGRSAVGDKTRPKRRVKGEQHPSAKLSAENVQEIRQRVEHGEQQAALARHFGVSKVAIGHLVRRTSWKSIA